MAVIEKFQLAIDHAFDGIALLNDKGDYYYMNKAHCKLFGYENADELLGKSWTTIYAPDYAEKLAKNVMPLVMEAGHWSGETIGKSKDDKPVVQYISLTKMPDDEMLCVCRDHSTSINASRLEYLMSNLGKGVLVEDEDHRVLLVNRQFCNLFHIPLQPAQMIGMNCLESLTETLTLFKEPQKVTQDIYAMSGKKEPVVGAEVTLADGRILERDYVPIIVEKAFKGQLWSYTDVTQNRLLQKSLIEAKNRAVASEKAKSSFLSNMSHEIRTPMNAIIGFSEQLNFSPLTDQQSFFLKNISEAAKGLLGIINDILDISKLEAGKMNIENDRVSLEEIKSSVENILKPKAEEKGLQFTTEFDHDINENLLADEVRLRQVLINVLGNAIKFTDNGFVKLTISLEKSLEKTQTIKFVCEDTGVGISKEAMVHIFEDFYQESHAGNNHRSTGSGLGLAITKNIISLMGGEIDVESEKNVGTKVTFSIPFEIVSSEDLIKSKPAFIDCTLIMGKKILLVEDNHLNRMLFNMMLSNLKAEVDEAENGLEALDKLKTKKYDLILMDIQMPIMDGPTALASIKRLYGDSIPVIALTAAAFKSEVNHLLNLGFSDCITKPVDQKNLEHRLCEFFSYGSVRNKYYNSIRKKIISTINEMAGNDPVQSSKMMNYLLEEVDFALIGWKDCIESKNWDGARKILHREKVMIKSIGINGYDGMIKEIEDTTIEKTEAEMILLFSQLVDLFQNLKDKFTQNIGKINK
jgi:PAS domain S-box-containing protein